MDESDMTKHPKLISAMAVFLVAALVLYKSLLPADTSEVNALAHNPSLAPTAQMDSQVSVQEPERLTSRATPRELPIIRSVDSLAISNAKALASPEPDLPMRTASPYDILPIGDPAAENDNVSPAIRKINQKFQQESYDVQWAAMVESETWEAFYQADLKSSEIESVDCRTSICKIIVIHNDAEAEQQFHQKLLAKLNGERGALHHQISQDGIRSTTLFRQR